MLSFSEKLGNLPSVGYRDHLPLDIFGGWHLCISPDSVLIQSAYPFSKCMTVLNATRPRVTLAGSVEFNLE